MTSFLISDTHFGHTNSWAVFKNDDGSPLRPFSSTEEMNEFMVQQWNSKVNPQDTVYHLGDVVINKKYLNIISRLNGKKRLIRGNHDIFKDQMYRDVGFQKIYGVRVFVDKFILSHIPLHPDCITDRFKFNVHGHLHGNRVLDLPRGKIATSSNKKQFIDPRYFSVCVEQTNYSPLAFEEVEKLIEDQCKEYKYTPPKGWGNGSKPS